jgi:hypothetical protein
MTVLGRLGTILQSYVNANINSWQRKKDNDKQQTKIRYGHLVKVKFFRSVGVRSCIKRGYDIIKLEVKNLNDKIQQEPRNQQHRLQRKS